MSMHSIVLLTAALFLPLGLEGVASSIALPQGETQYQAACPGWSHNSDPRLPELRMQFADSALRKRIQTAVSQTAAPDSCIRLRGGVSKYYNHTASPNRGGIFEEPTSGVGHDEGQSVWNKGGWTWEEKDMTSFCRARLNELLPTVATAPAPIRFVNVTWVKGHALVTYRQGKKLCGVNWDEVTVGWELAEEAPWREKGVNGTVKLRDFYSDFPEDIEMEVTVWGSGLSSAEHQAITRCVMGFRDKLAALPGLLVDAMLQHKASSPSIQALDRAPSAASIS